jgi:hypothetical protein
MGVRSLGLIAASLLLVACPGDPTDNPVDAPTDGDGSLPGNGLTIDTNTNHGIPASIGDGNIKIEEVWISTRSIRAIGDAAPGDERTTKLDVGLHWDDEDDPDKFTFDRAPSGRYSTVRLQVAAPESGDQDAAFQIKGEVKIDDTFRKFEVDSETSSFQISVAVDTVLPAGGTAEIDLELVLEGLVDTIDFTLITPDGDGVRVIDDSDSEMAIVRAALETAFRSDSTAAN